MLGVCFDNRENPPPATYDKLRRAKPEVIGTLWINGCLHREGIYAACENTLTPLIPNGVHYSLRVGPSSKVDANTWIAWARDAIRQVPSSIRDAGRVSVRVLNEVNLPDEGAWTPQEYAALLDDINPLWLSDPLLRDISLIAAPISLGIPNATKWWTDFIDATNGGESAFDEAAVNVYAHNVDLAGMLMIPGVPMHVTEISTLDIAPSIERADWILQKYNSLKSLGYRSVQQFIVDGWDPTNAWPDAYIMSSDECDRIGSRPL